MIRITIMITVIIKIQNLPAPTFPYILICWDRSQLLICWIIIDVQVVIGHFLLLWRNIFIGRWHWNLSIHLIDCSKISRRLMLEKDRIKYLSLTVAWLMPKILLICIMILTVQKPKWLIITPKILIALFITDVRHSHTLVQSQGYLWMNYVKCNAFKVKNYMPKVLL